MKTLKCRRGSIIVEASIVFPIILILIFSTIYLTMDFFTGTVAETRSDNAAFSEGFGESAGIRNASLIGDLIHGDE